MRSRIVALTKKPRKGGNFKMKLTHKRQIFLDTETTGLEISDGHRIIEIGCVEMVDRKLTGNRYHQYVQPDKTIDEGAFEVHGISNESLLDKPRFSEIYPEFLKFVKDSDLIIHNSAFDVGFLNHEFNLCDKNFIALEKLCAVVDSLKIARKKHPGQKNNLNALCKRYDVDNTHRDLHGALLDAEILAEVYLRMTGGQLSLSFGSVGENDSDEGGINDIRTVDLGGRGAKIIMASQAELEAHRDRLENIKAQSGSLVDWPET